MQNFHNRCTLPASTSQVIAAITTEEYLLYRYEDPDLHHLHIEISQNDAQGFACCVTRSGSTHKLPGFVRSVLGDAITMVQSQTWQGRESPVHGTLRIHLEGLPGQVEFELKLSDVDERTSVLEAEGQVEVRIPLLGGRLEKLLLSKASEAFEKSMEAIRAYVESHCV